jgi:uncharacterized membrane protein YozB (DUF420 family)
MWCHYGLGGAYMPSGFVATMVSLVNQLSIELCSINKSLLLAALDIIHTLNCDAHHEFSLPSLRLELELSFIHFHFSEILGNS